MRKLKPGFVEGRLTVMHITPFKALACPLDGKPLRSNGTAWRCAGGHSFDIASQGYAHLLPVQNKRSRDPGDSKEMVAARRRFLDAGHYLPIADAARRAVLADTAPNATIRCLDAGCGEGYYLRQLAVGNEATEARRLALIGLDISKWAVLSAAKQDKRMVWIVGSNANLPVLSGTLDRVLCMFGFPVYAEFARVLAAQGQLVQIDAGPDHLRELREIIYPVLKAERAIEIPIPTGFAGLSNETVRYSVEISGQQQIADLLAMTPHLYRDSSEGRARVAALQSLPVTVDIRLTRYLRN